MADAAREKLIEDARTFYARQMAAVSGSADPRLERVFEAVPREAFLPPGPWDVRAGDGYIRTPSADPIHLYQNVLVALDRDRRVNTGEPFLHARWLGRAAPQPGETVCHVGAGAGYYTALLSMLVLPSGQVVGYEIDAERAAAAQDNLRPFEGVSLIHGDATQLDLPLCDLIYVNAGVLAPPTSWLRALRPGGRMIMPWRPAETVGLAIVVSRPRDGEGFTVEPLMPSWFIPCVGASEAEGSGQAPDRTEAWASRSLWMTGDREPDETATAIYRDLWFSRSPAGRTRAGVPDAG